uniref:FCH domain-containing protein n=1 Tax=Xiphophorus couchianus TaxID=32473 RepID=A0A3B5KRA0_9TELE
PSPHPRSLQQVKLLFSEQLSKLQSKHHQDTELLEEIRSFSKQRAAIEKEYAQVRTHGLFRSTAGPFTGTFYGFTRNVFGVWRSVVDATAQTATSRLAAAEEYRQLFGDASKMRWHANLMLRIIYHIAGVAREKAAGAQTRTRKSEHGIFHFKSGQHKMTAKLSARLKECEDRLNEARNEYLLTLAAVNSHHQHYHTKDLPLLMETGKDTVIPQHLQWKQKTEMFYR